MSVKINNRRFRVPKGKREDSLIPSAEFVMRNMANGTAPKANKFNPHAEKLPGLAAILAAAPGAPRASLRVAAGGGAGGTSAVPEFAG